MPQIINQQGKRKTVNELIAGNVHLMRTNGYVPYYEDALKYSKKILARVGDFEDSNGGVINPGMLSLIEGFLRVDANFFGYHGHKDKAKCRPILYNTETRTHKEVTLPEFDTPTLAEDYRPFAYKDRTFIICAIYQKNWQQALFEYANNACTLVKIFDSPENREEKNWGWFVNGDKLFYIYSLSPYIVYEFDIETLESKRTINESFKNPLGQSILSVSSLPVKYGDGWLLWVHCKHSNYYAHSIMTIGPDMLPTALIPYSVLRSGVIVNDKFKFDYLYISSCIVDGDKIYAFAGEGESEGLNNYPTAYASVRTFDKNEVDSLLKLHPCATK